MTHILIKQCRRDENDKETVSLTLAMKELNRMNKCVCNFSITQLVSVAVSMVDRILIILMI